MTDGIIQKVLNEYVFWATFTQTPQLYARYLELQLELIEEIKKEFDDEGFLSHHTEVKKKLIGDNE